MMAGILTLGADESKETIGSSSAQSVSSLTERFEGIGNLSNIPLDMSQRNAI